jgi:hypothetical protein
MADRYQETPCPVVVSNNYDTCGTITRASIAHLTPTQLESLFKQSGLFADMDAWFRTSFEMKACGTKTNGMYDWVMSSQRNMRSLLSYEKIDKGPSLLHPFVLGRQDSVINKDFWAITQGQAKSAYTAGVTGPLTSDDLALGVGTDRVIRVVNRYGIDLDAKWFVSRDTVHIFGRASGVATLGQWKVLASAAASDLSYVDVLITTQNAASSTPYDTAPTAGVLLPGGNNVNDFESWCNNRPTLDPRKRVPFWYQTMRRTRCVDSEYIKVFTRLMESNKYFQEFGDLPLAERNRQDEEEFQRRWLHSFFFGKPISANQTLALYQSLEQIETVTGTNTDPGLGGKVIAYRANMIGVYEQLRRCDRVRDVQNNPLNLYELFQNIYQIVRSRKSQGKMANSIDIYTDSEYAALFETAMIEYYKNEYGNAETRINIEEGSMENLGFEWRTYRLKWPFGVKINIITHEFFDDIASAHATEGIGSRGTFLLILDMGKPGPKGGTIYPGTIASNKVVHTLGQLEQLARLDRTFACTMENVTEEISLTSETCTAVVECPSNSLWIENVARVKPVTTGVTGSSYTNLY